MLLHEIRRQRLIQINRILDSFKDLPPSLQTEKYKKYLIDTKDSLKPVTLVVPFNKVNRIIGQGRLVLKQLEKSYKCRISIESSSKAESIISIEGDDASAVVRHLEEVIFSTKKSLNVNEMTDWEKFYVWWAYFNKKNI